MHENNFNETVEITKSLYRHPDLFDDFISAARHFPYSKVYSRLLLWLDFFNESFLSHHCVHYHGTIESLFQVWFNSKVLQEQTAYEFDLSKQFYLSFFEIAKGTIFVDTVATKKLLILSFIFSRYHGMMLNSMLHQFGEIISIVRAEDIDKIFEKTFIKYQTPKYLISNFEELTAEEIQIMMEGIQGKNLRKHPVFLNKITRHEFALLGSLATNNLRYKDYIMLRGAIIVQLTNCFFDEGILHVFLRASGTFMMNPERYFQDIEYWKKGYEFVIDGIRGPQICTITDCVDFLEYKKYQTDEPFSLKGRTTNSFFRLVSEWHGFVSHLNFDHFRKEKWEKSKLLDLQFIYDNKTFQCIELHSGESLYREGKELNHCVVTYTPQCKGGLCSIWSLRQWDNQSKKFFPILTLEIAEGKIIQARGLNDRLPLENEFEIIADWAERVDLEIELIKNE